MPNPRINAAQMKAKALKKAKENKVKSKKGSPTKKTGTPKTSTKKTDFKYKKIEDKGEMPKFKLEKEIKVKMKKKDLKLKKGSPAKKEGNITVKGKKATVKNGSVYKNGNYVGPVGSKDLKPDKNNLKPSKAALAADAKKKADAKNKEKGSPAKMSGRSYDMKMAYDKKLTPKARLHYLENERHDAPGKMKGSPYHKHGSPYHMNHSDSPMHKDLVGKQGNLPPELKAKIEAAPQMKGSPYHMSNELKYGGPVIDQMKTLSQIGTSKVLRHMKK